MLEDFFAFRFLKRGCSSVVVWVGFATSMMRFYLLAEALLFYSVSQS